MKFKKIAVFCEDVGHARDLSAHGVSIKTTVNYKQLSVSSELALGSVRSSTVIALARVLAAQGGTPK